MFESVQKRAAAFTRDGLKVRRLIGSCKKLLSERGEAAGVSLAKTTLDLYSELDIKDQARFFSELLAQFSPDPKRVLEAAQAYAVEASAANLRRLSTAAEPHPSPRVGSLPWAWMRSRSSSSIRSPRRPWTPSFLRVRART